MTKTIIKSIEPNKAEFVNKMFARIAAKYDLLNNLMTLGFHKKWKENTIKMALSENMAPKNAIDLCCGSGDLAIILQQLSPKTLISCLDNCQEMINITNKKIIESRINNITANLADCENLTNSPSSIELITIGFGLRNLTNQEKCLSNIYRILTKGGVFACIDLGHPEKPICSRIYAFYFFKVIPLLGKYFARDKEAYTYLPTSLLSWYKQNELKELLLKTGFKKSYYKNIFGGIAAIHIAVK